MVEFDLVIRGGTIADGTGGELIEADLAVRAGKIVAIGKGLANGAEEIDAKGRVVTPGFVDVHTHYDGQAIWGEEMSPSSSHGVTTVIMGNCGVGFAPCRAEDHAMLVNVMEGVEDIPGVVMTEGLPWDWETFPEYLDRLDAGKRDIDVAAYLPHSPLRVYVMGERGARQEAATEDDLAKMRTLTKEAMEAGAIGFATSRLSIHKTADGGAIPTFDADLQELQEIAGGMTDAGKGTFQIVVDAFRGWDVEYPIIDAVAQSSGRPATFTLANTNNGPPRWRTVLEQMAETKKRGGQVTAQVMPRPIGVVIGLELSVHPFILCPSWANVADLPLAKRVEAMRDPGFRAAILIEEPGLGHPLVMLGRNWRWIFPFDEHVNYAPTQDQSLEALATARGCTPAEVAYDFFVESDGQGLMLNAIGNFENNSLAATREMLAHPDCIPALGDGGAHYGAICDASYSTFLLKHYVRDGRDGGFGLAEAIHMLTQKAARAVGLNDRGVLAVGMKADINVIDMDRLTLHLPDIVHDLPAGGRRLDQKATGYDATIVSGEVIRRMDRGTGARPGQLVRA